MQGRRIGRFLVERPLKAGGMGAVFVARDVVLDRQVALKVLPESAEADGERRAWLLREARAAASISHPHVATVFEAGHDGGTVYLAMELVAGEDLATRLTRGPLALDELRRIGLGIAAGLGAAHAAGVLHRDLKPANVMLTEGGVPKLVDFGLARPPTPRDDGLKSLTGRIGGTPGYMPPEQIRGEAADPRTDLFALGVVLFEAWTGTAPFGHDGMAALVRTVEGDRPSVTALRPTPAPLAQLLDRLLAPTRAARPDHARDVAAVLEALGGSERIVVRTLAGPRLAGSTAPPTDAHAATVLPAALASTAPPAPAPESRPSSAALPLVGRAETVERVVDVLRQYSRLVTITGPPGIGKTAVAKEVASRLRSRGERVLLVPLSGSRDLEAALALALGAGRSVEAALAAETGVVHLDGGEHLELSPRLEHWLTLSPARFLVSARARLDLPEEEVVELGPLEPEAAAELFLARARRARPALADGDDLRAAARAVAAAVDGHPLALVLAAARAALLSPAEIAARLGEAPLALVGEPAAREPGLRQCVAPSIDRLAASDAALLLGLALFEEPFDAAAGEAMARALAPRTDPLGALDRLRAGSLLRSIDGDGGVRLAIERVVREVLRERLEASGLARAATDAFVAHVVGAARDGVLEPGRGRALVHERARSLARAAALAAPGDRAAHWITVLQAFQRPAPEHEPRLGHALSAGGLAPELACAIELALVSRRMEHDVVAAAALARQALEHASGVGPALLALARSLSFDALVRAHRHDEAATQAEAMLAEARASGRVGDEVDALERLGTLNWRRARHDEGLVQLRRALELAETLRDRGRQAAVLLAWGILLVQERRFAEARGFYERAGALARAVHMDRLGGVLANNLGVILHEEGDLPGAQAAFSETHALALRTGRPLLAAVGLLNRGMLRHEVGELAAAGADLDDAIAGAAALGETRYRIIALGARAAVRADRGDVRGAEEDLATASALLGASPERQLALALSVRAAHVELSLAQRAADPARLAVAQRTAAAFRAELADPASPLARSENARMAMRQLRARHPA